MTIISKIMYTLVLWVFWAMIASAIFGEGSLGILIQGVIQIGGTIYIWTRPKKVNEEVK